MVEAGKRTANPCATRCGVAKEMSIKKIGERRGLLWKFSEKKGEGETYFDENLKGQFKNRTQERKGFWEVWWMHNFKDCRLEKKEEAVMPRKQFIGNDGGTGFRQGNGSGEVQVRCHASNILQKIRDLHTSRANARKRRRKKRQ